MLRYSNDATGSKYSVSSKIGMPSQEFQYPSISKHNILRGAATVHPHFVKCRETPNTTRIDEAPNASDGYTNGYQWNENPIRTNAPSERL